eukprot:2312775-Amphidinium_carterae.2
MDVQLRSSAYNSGSEFLFLKCDVKANLILSTQSLGAPRGEQMLRNLSLLRALRASKTRASSQLRCANCARSTWRI